MEQVNKNELLELIDQLLEEKAYEALTKKLKDVYPVDLAEVFEDLPPENCAILFRLLPKDEAAEAFSYLSSGQQRHIASAAAAHAGLLNHIYDELSFDDKIDFLGEMPANFVRTILANSSRQERGLINQFLRYPDNSAGGLMTIEYMDLKKNMTAADALKRIKETGMDKETIYSCYVLDSTRKLQGIVSLRHLVLAEDDVKVGDIMETDIVMVKALDDQESVAELIRKYDLMAIPVVDNENRLIGIITVDDVIDVIEQENTEDFEKMAAMKPSDKEYLDTGVFALAKNRIVWLLVLMVSATFTGGIIAHYENLLSTAVILTAFIPMLMDSGGNAGSQSSTLIIRGLALGEITLMDWGKVLWKELRVGLIAGTLLAVVNCFRMMILSHTSLEVTIAVSMTLIATVTFAKLVGGILPIGAKALKMDPAIMAGPLITTIVDALALVIYFSIASKILVL